MPITQDRLITLIEIADSAMAYAESINALCGNAERLRTALEIASDEIGGASAHGNASAKRVIESTIGFLFDLKRLNEQRPLSPTLREKLVEERTRFRLTAKKNDVAKEYRRRTRAVEDSAKSDQMPIWQRMGLTKEEFDAAQADLKALETAPTATPAAQATREAGMSPSLAAPPAATAALVGLAYELEQARLREAAAREDVF